MKGIILAGGSGSRLYPMTRVTSKQLLPVYDKPLICYPLSMLMLAGITDILIISTPQDTPIIEQYLGDGSDLGLKFSYRVQENPNGLAEAFILGEEFIGDDPVCLVLGDNIFHVGDQIAQVRHATQNIDDHAVIYSYYVADPRPFGVIEYEKDTDKVLSLEEKPANPKSRYISVGLYMYPNDVCARAKALEPSHRGELEITDLNKSYLADDKLSTVKFKRGSAWLDAGTPDSLLDAAVFVGAVEKRQGLKIACLPEIAFRLGYINQTKFQSIIDGIKDGSSYKAYLKLVLEEG